MDGIWIIEEKSIPRSRRKERIKGEYGCPGIQGREHLLGKELPGDSIKAGSVHWVKRGLVGSLRGVFLWSALEDRLEWVEERK